jgi:hypothetical protein
MVVAKGETVKTNGALVKKDDAILGAAVSAAVGAAVYGLRKAFREAAADRQVGQHDDDYYGRDDDGRSESMLVTVWESAFASLLPLAEQAAEAAGKWAAEDSPALIRDRLLPRFIESFRRAA